MLTSASHILSLLQSELEYPRRRLSRARRNRDKPCALLQYRLEARLRGRGRRMQGETKPRAQTSRDDSESFETQQPLPHLCSVLSRPDLERIGAQNCRTTQSDALIPASQLPAQRRRCAAQSELDTTVRSPDSRMSFSEAVGNIRPRAAARAQSRHKGKKH